MEEGFTTKGYKQPLEVETKARKWLILQNLQKECGPVHTLISASVQFSYSVVSNSLRPHEPQHTRPPYHQLPEFTQTHVHCVGEAIQPSHPFIPSPPALNLSQHQIFSNESALPIK